MIEKSEKRLGFNVNVDQLLEESGSVLVPGMVTEAVLLTAAEDDELIEALSVIVTVVATGIERSVTISEEVPVATLQKPTGLQSQAPPTLSKVEIHGSLNGMDRMSLGPLFSTLMENVKNAPATALATGVMLPLVTEISDVRWISRPRTCEVV